MQFNLGFIYSITYLYHFMKRSRAINSIIAAIFKNLEKLIQFYNTGDETEY